MWGRVTDHHGTSVNCMSERTVDTIIAELSALISDREKSPDDPGTFLRSAMYLNLLLLPELQKLIDFESQLAIMEQANIAEGKSNADAKSKAKATPLWKEYKLQQAKVKMIEQHVLIAKKWASVTAMLGG